ncbi:MAG: FUSC family protein [Verrucomicrobiales bacterium]
MRELLQFNWRAIDHAATVKISIGLIVMLVLTKLTGQPWLATALAAMFAWLANTPGPLKNRIGGMAAFALIALILTLVFDWIGLALWPNVVAIAIVALAGTAALLAGIRAFMVGWSSICWAIYGPFLVATTSVNNCLLAVLAGTGIIIGLNIIGEWLGGRKASPPSDENEEPPSTRAAIPGIGDVIAYALTVAAVLAFTTYWGWGVLEMDPTLMVGGAFFVIGFDLRKTWVSGIARILGLISGVALGLLFAKLLGPGLPLDIIMILACGLSFGAVAVHPGAWMFFFMIFVAAGWPGLDPATSDQAMKERFFGETVGVVIAIAGLGFLHWWQTRRSRGAPPTSSS